VVGCFVDSFFCSCSSASFLFFSSFWIPALLNFLAAIVELSGIVFLFQNGIVVPIVYGLGAWVFSSILVVVYRYLTSETHRRHLKTAFSKYVSPQVLNEIMRHPENITLGGEEREVTVFFSDIRGFTTISEKTTPTELVRILNKYFTAMTAQVLNNGLSLLGIEAPEEM
jgi:adenylate cyclase